MKFSPYFITQRRKYDNFAKPAKRLLNDSPEPLQPPNVSRRPVCSILFRLRLTFMRAYTLETKPFRFWSAFRRCAHNGPLRKCPSERSQKRPTQMSHLALKSFDENFKLLANDVFVSFACRRNWNINGKTAKQPTCKVKSFFCRSEGERVRLLSLRNGMASVNQRQSMSEMFIRIPSAHLRRTSTARVLIDVRSCIFIRFKIRNEWEMEPLSGWPRSTARLYKIENYSRENVRHSLMPLPSIVSAHNQSAILFGYFQSRDERFTRKKSHV